MKSLLARTQQWTSYIKCRLDVLLLVIQRHQLAGGEKMVNRSILAFMVVKSLLVCLILLDLICVYIINVILFVYLFHIQLANGMVNI